MFISEAGDCHQLCWRLHFGTCVELEGAEQARRQFKLRERITLRDRSAIWWGQPYSIDLAHELFLISHFKTDLSIYDRNLWALRRRRRRRRMAPLHQARRASGRLFCPFGECTQQLTGTGRSGTCRVFTRRHSITQLQSVRTSNIISKRPLSNSIADPRSLARQPEEDHNQSASQMALIFALEIANQRLRRRRVCDVHQSSTGLLLTFG